MVALCWLMLFRLWSFCPSATKPERCRGLLRATVLVTGERKSGLVMRGVLRSLPCFLPATRYGLAHPGGQATAVSCQLRLFLGFFAAGLVVHSLIVPLHL